MSPSYQSLKRVDDKLVLTFESVGSGLVTGKPRPLDLRHRWPRSEICLGGCDDKRRFNRLIS